MEYFTLLIFSYVVADYHVETSLVFDTEAKCEQALRASDPLYDVVYDNYETAMVGCERTDILSASIRPRMRPTQEE